MTQQGRYMLMFSLGPVQTFIAQARKTRDLWLGSYLLSKLMEAAMEGLKGDLVYPTDRTVDSERDIPDIPNKFVAIFQSSEEAYEEVRKCKIRIERRWEEIRDKVWQEIVAKYATEDTERIWKRQTSSSNLFETFWVIVAEQPQGYKQWLEDTEKAFDARKRLRDFEPQVQGEPGEKSTISGEREALRGGRADRKGVQDFWVSLTERRSARDISKDGSERLDAIDTVKRFANKSPHIPDKPFPSTSSIATASFVEQLLKATIAPDVLKRWRDTTNVKELVEQAEDAIWAIPYLGNMVAKPEMAEREWILQRDGDLYFPETFVTRRLEKDYNVTNIANATRIATEGRKALTALLTATNDKQITPPTPYYSVIQMDGDKMGILLSGVQGQGEHVEISKALSTFSRMSAPELVEDHYPGRLIYAGGDDVFALAPLARDVTDEKDIGTVLNLVDRLQQQYCATVAKAVLDEERKKYVTASTGIAIAHHYTSLSYVRRMAKAAEELAKDHYERNAVVITVIRRSGEQTRVGCHWHYDSIHDKDGQPVVLFSRFYELFKDDVLSPKCVHILLEEAGTLVGLEEKAQQSEIKRVLQRQYDKNKASKLKSENELAKLAIQLVDLAEAMDSDQKNAEGKKQHMAVELHASERRYGLIEVLGWLLVMSFLARKDQE